MVARAGIGVSVDELAKYIDPKRRHDSGNEPAHPTTVQCHVVHLLVAIDRIYAAGVFHNCLKTAADDEPSGGRHGGNSTRAG